MPQEVDAPVLFIRFGNFYFCQLADEYLVTTAYAGTFGQECVNVLIAQENNSTAGGTPPAIDVTSIYTQICPGQCSGHGTCTNATCICHTGIVFNTIVSSVCSIEI